MNPFTKDCPYARELRGRRTYSAYVPDSCQGCYFPGDEPGLKCSHSGQRCEDENGDRPDLCCIQERIGLCPICWEEDVQSQLFRNGRGVCHCEHGHKIEDDIEGCQCPA